MIRNLIPSAVVIVATVAMLFGLGVYGSLPAAPVTVLTPDGRGGFIVEQRSAHSVAVERAERDSRRLQASLDRYQRSN